MKRIKAACLEQTIHFILNEESFLGGALFADAGQAMNYSKLNNIRDNFLICRGTVNEFDALSALEASVSGKKYSSLRVLVDEITKISHI